MSEPSGDVGGSGVPGTAATTAPDGRPLRPMRRSVEPVAELDTDELFSGVATFFATEAQPRVLTGALGGAWVRLEMRRLDAAEQDTLAAPLIEAAQSPTLGDPRLFRAQALLLALSIRSQRTIPIAEADGDDLAPRPPTAADWRDAAELWPDTQDERLERVQAMDPTLFHRLLRIASQESGYGFLLASLTSETAVSWLRAE